jgi:hypothetical protein
MDSPSNTLITNSDQAERSQFSGLIQLRGVQRRGQRLCSCTTTRFSTDSLFINWFLNFCHRLENIAGVQRVVACVGLAGASAPDADYQALQQQFSDKEIVELTFAIGVINTWNRLSIGLRKQPDSSPYPLPDSVAA